MGIFHSLFTITGPNMKLILILGYPHVTQGKRSILFP